MDDYEAILAEERAAMEEHERAMAEVSRVREIVEKARMEYEAAKATEKKYENEIASATESLSKLLVTPPAVEEPPPRIEVVDEVVEYYSDIKVYYCALQLNVTLTEAKAEHVFARVYRKRIVIVEMTDENDKSHLLWHADLARDIEDVYVAETKGKHMTVRASSDDNDPYYNSPAEERMMDEIDMAHYESINCRACSRDLLVWNGFLRSLALPTPAWVEMVDFWGVPDNEFNHFLQQRVISGDRRYLLIGESAILVHRDHVGGAIKDGESTCREDMVSVCCKNCGATLGFSPRSDPNSIHLYKYCIAPVSRCGGGNVFELYKVDSVLAAKLTQEMESVGVFRFYVESNLASYPKHLLVILISWKGELRPKGSKTFQRVLKVHYREEDKVEPEESGTYYLPLAPNQVRERFPEEIFPMVLQHETYIAIQKRLDENTSLVLPEQRLPTFDRVSQREGMRLSYLFAGGSLLQKDTIHYESFI